MDIFRFLRSVLSMNDATGNYLWVAPLKLDLFPYILRPFTSSPHVLYNFQGLDLIDLRLSGKKEGLPKFLHPFFLLLQGVNFMVSIQRRVQWRVSAYLPSLLYWPGHKSDSCGHRTHSLRPLKMTPDGNWSYLA